MPRLAIVGAGDLGRETAALVEEVNAAADVSKRWDLVGFVDDALRLQQIIVQDLPVCGDTDWLREQRALHYVVAVGNPQARRHLYRRLQGASLAAASLLHPTISLHRTSAVGPGCLVARGSTLTVSVTAGRGVIVDLHCSISHDVTLGDYVTLHPGVRLTGHVRVGVAAELGAGCVVLPGVTVGAEAVVGAGAVVHRDVPPGVTVAGVPAQPLRGKDEGRKRGG